MKLHELNAVTKSGNKIIAYFETGQGSKYILSDKGESKRIKSFHANTGASDTGLKAWYDCAVFINPKFEKQANAFQLLINNHKYVLLQRQSSKIVLFILKDKNWVPAKNSDAYPKAVSNGVLKDEVLAFSFVENPTLNFNVLEYNLNANKTIKNYHFGSPVTKIKKISDLTADELTQFKDNLAEGLSKKLFLENKFEDAVNKIAKEFDYSGKISSSDNGEWTTVRIGNQSVSFKITNGTLHLADMYIPDDLKNKGFLTAVLKDIRKFPNLNGDCIVHMAMNPNWEKIVTRSGFQFKTPQKILPS